MANAITPTRAQTDGDGEDQVPTEVEAEVKEVPVVVETDYVPVLHTAGSLPKASGSIPPTFNAVTLAAQRQTALDFYNFLSADTPLLRLNKGNTVFTALVSIPKTKFVKVVFCPGIGTSPIGVAASPVDDKFLLLHGDGSIDISPPLPCAFLPV